MAPADLLDVAAWRLHRNEETQAPEFKMTRLSMFRSLLLTVFFFVLSGHAVAATPEADQFVKDRYGQLVALLQQPKNAAREKQVSASIDEVFDYEQLAARSLGEEWKNRTNDERKQFQDLLEQLVRQSYRKSIDSTLGYVVEYKGTRTSGSDTIVVTVAKHKTDKRKAPISIDYALLRNDGKWKAVDVVVEGSSLVNNYRSQFTRIIKKKGFSELVTKMKRKLEKGEG